ncbi:LysR family transcriptional regulator [Silvimonas iriomotensis]|uniref:LysR family transcriptional regulator n=1 Tax=Silvimonas iriomotensis TaxID=449662 RepID=A0ABQ2P5I1_9NEIS|nr:LysR family transcriptional regulator [Silvimonas iriomotensis]GGP18372.1 LysR family transcriptional regulator [Silvimonas iriomotensis]
MKQNLKIDPTQLPALLAFERVARHGNFSKAADEMGVSPSALSQTIRNLEARTGIHLLNRTTRRVSVTEAGMRLLSGVTPGLAQIEAALIDLEDLRDQPAGTLRINLPRLAYRIIVAPYLAGFMAAYPDLRVEFRLDEGLSDIVGESFDAGIRFGESVARDMVAARIGRNRRIAVAATPDYLDRHGRPQVPEDLFTHNCLRYRFVTSGRLYAWEFTRDGREFEIDLAGRLVYNDIYDMVDAARLGLGIVHITEDVIAADLASGVLERVLDDWCAPFDGFFLYYPNRALMPRKLRVFIDWFQHANQPPAR